MLKKLPVNKVHLYHMQLSERQIDPSSLAPDEQIHYHKIIHSKKKQEFLCSRLMQKKILSMYRENPVVERPPQQKPYVRGNGPEFNISHSGNRLCLAVAHQAIGVDIEQIKERPSWANLLQRYFSENERSQIHSLKDFYFYWTRKEAYLKCLGQSVAKLLDGLDTTTIQDHTFYPLDIAEDIQGHMASAQSDLIIEYYEITADDIC